MREIFHEGNYNVLPDSHRKLSFRQSVVSGQHYSAAWVSEFLFHCLVAADFAIFHPIAFKTLSLILNKDWRDIYISQTRSQWTDRER